MILPARRPSGPDRTGPLGWLGRACYHHRGVTLAAWLTGVICLVALWTQFGAAASTSYGGADPGQAVLNRYFPAQSGDALTLAITSAKPITAPATAARVTAALAPFARAPHVTSVTDPYRTPGHVSRDGHVAFATVQFGVPAASVPGGETAGLIADARAASGGGLTFSLGGDLVDDAETSYGGPSDGFGVGAAAVVLLIAFGSLLAMVLPVATALAGIGAGLALAALLGHVFPAPFYAAIIAALIGLGVGVDYALFVLTRYREALRAGQDPAAATVTAMRTAGRSVLVAGTTVVIGLCGLLVLRQPLMTGVAVAAAVTVAMTVLAALTLLPALFGFTGTRLAAPSRLVRRRHRSARLSSRPGALGDLSDPAGTLGGSVPLRSSPGWEGDRDGTTYRGGTAERWARLVQRHRVAAAVAATGVLLVLAAPALGMKLNMPDDSAQARGTMGYASWAAMTRGFGPGAEAPLIVAATRPAHGTGTATGTGTAASPGPGSTSAAAPARDPGVAKLAAAVAATPGVTSVTPVTISRDGRAALLVAYPATSAQNPATTTLANRISGTVLPRATAGTGIRAWLTGPNAADATFADQMGHDLPALIAIVAGAGLILLLVTFRSVLVAVKAAALNLLSVLASYGILVMVVQHGWLRGLFGFPETMPVTTWVPIFAFVILFGLSMDYEVFLLSRIREDWDRTGDNGAAVASGLARTARVITAAAAIMVLVFLANVVGAADVSVKQIGLGLAAAVLIDATVVRLVLVPALMELLGRANWWLPRPLARLLPAPALRDSALRDSALREVSVD